MLRIRVCPSCGEKCAACSTSCSCGYRFSSKDLVCFFDEPSPSKNFLKNSVSPAEERVSPPQGSGGSITLPGVLKFLLFVAVCFLLFALLWFLADFFFLDILVNGFSFPDISLSNLPFAFIVLSVGILVILAISLFCIALGISVGYYKVKTKFARTLSAAYCIFCVVFVIVLRFSC